MAWQVCGKKRKKGENGNRIPVRLGVYEIAKKNRKENENINIRIEIGQKEEKNGVLIKCYYCLFECNKKKCPGIS